MICGNKSLKMLLILAAFLPAFLIMPRTASGEAVFRWTDDQGTVGFTDDPSRIPAIYREQSEAKMRRESTPLRAEKTEEPTKAEDAAKPRVPLVSLENIPVDEKKESAEKREVSAYDKVLEAMPVAVDNLGHDKQYWKNRRKHWERRLETSEALLARTKREFGLTNQRFDKREYARLKELRERMRETEADIAQANAMLDGGLAQEARRAGAEPGWVR